MSQIYQKLLLTSVLYSPAGIAPPQTNRPSSATTELILKFYIGKSIGTELSLRIVTFLGDLDVMRGLQTQKVLLSAGKNLHLQIASTNSVSASMTLCRCIDTSSVSCFRTSRCVPRPYGTSRAVRAKFFKDRRLSQV